ncbi:MAG TPA: hypothetical protein VH061_13200 [Solirubrobacteraceae bacterium]|jgi:hypothetical protein|nr:hypothetical protein [Solirubrobacteraceae bacterium]
MELLSWGIVLRRAALLALAVVGILFYVADVASAEWSYFYSHLEGTYELGGELTFTAEGSLAGPMRIFVFVESTKCEGTPAREEATPGARRLTPPEGEPLGPGSYLKTYTYTVATVHQLSGICEYVGSYSPTAGEGYGGAAMCEQEPGSSFFESPGRCSMPHISQSELAAIQQSELERRTEAQELQMWAAQKQREEARTKEAVEHAKQAEAQRAKSMRCTVPGLHGHTLSGSRQLLSSAHCALGKVRIRRGGRGPLRVLAQTPRRDTTLRSGGHVTLTIGRRSI